MVVPNTVTNWSPFIFIHTLITCQLASHMPQGLDWIGLVFVLGQRSFVSIETTCTTFGPYLLFDGLMTHQGSS